MAWRRLCWPDLKSQLTYSLEEPFVHWLRWYFILSVNLLFSFDQSLLNSRHRRPASLSRVAGAIAIARCALWSQVFNQPHPVWSLPRPNPPPPHTHFSARLSSVSYRQHQNDDGSVQLLVDCWATTIGGCSKMTFHEFWNRHHSRNCTHFRR